MSSHAKLSQAIRIAYGRFDLRTALLSVLVVLVVDQIARLENFAFDAAEFAKFDRYRFINPSAWLVTMVPCVLVADALVAQGARPFRTYVNAAVLGSTLASAVQIVARLVFGSQIVPYPADPLNAAMQPVYLTCNFLIYGGAATLAYAYLRSAYVAGSVQRRAELLRLDVRRTTLELRLQSMQARVDPTLLFDTLAAVGPLYDVDASRADRLLDALIAFLRAALPQRLAEPSNFAQELDLLRAYIEVVKTRRGGGLDVVFALSDEAHGARLPPMLLLPLVDHLLAHRCSPGDATIRLQITARVSGHRFEVALCHDSAAPPLPIPAILRDRLSALFDTEGRIDVDATVDHGIRMVLEVPHVTTDRGPR